MSLHVSVTHRQGDFALDVSFASPGRLTALFGPSGSGKTTLINAIAGLIRPQRGRIAVDGRVLLDTSTGLCVGPHGRRIGYVFQDARLFPHMTVRRNLGYGRFFAPKSERYADFDGVVEILGISHLLERRPGQLSGGEKQRVAIGRALMASPRLVLMDEPLASLDEPRKAEILPYLERLRDETRVPIVYVSHSLSEVARLATDMVTLADGKVTACGPADDILRHTDIVAGEEDRIDTVSLIGASVAAHDRGDGLTRLRSASGDWSVSRLDAAPGTAVRIVLRARDVMVATQRPVGLSALNVVECDILDLDDLDRGEILVTLGSGDDRFAARLTHHSVQRLSLQRGSRVFAVVKAVSVRHI
jgi:molybdate transport system ATP-binding protein